MSNYNFNIKKITFKTDTGYMDLEPSAVNIFVGPNNSGKSRILKEVRDWLSGDRKDIKILEEMQCDIPDTFEDLDKAYRVSSNMQKDYYGNWFMGGYSNKPSQPFDMNMSYENYFARQSGAYGDNWKERFSRVVEQKEYQQFYEIFGKLFFQYLGTEERLMICKTQTSYGLNSVTNNFLSSIRYRADVLTELSEILQRLFDLDIYLDTQTLGNRLCFRVDRDLKDLKEVTQFSEKDANDLYSKDLLDDQGDGIKNFVAVYLSLRCNEKGALLLDEPEAFLHPPLARQVGELIGEMANLDRQIFISTHSVEVLKGVLSKCSSVKIIRITKPKPSSNNLRLIKKETLDQVLESPLFRVSRVLEGIFCERVVLTESESDELVYQEFIEKVFPESGLHFVHGQNKQTLGDIAKLYKEIGISFEVIVDFDILRDPREFSKLMESVGVPESKRSAFSSYAGNLRKNVNDSVGKSNLTEEEIKDNQKKTRDEVYHQKGIRWFQPDIQKKITESFDYLAQFHLHILEDGELETFLEEYDVEYSNNKKDWIIGAINVIASLEMEDLKKGNKAYSFVEQIVNNGTLEVR